MGTNTRNRVLLAVTAAIGMFGASLPTTGQVTTQAFDLTIPSGGSALINGSYFFPRYNNTVVSGSGTYGSYLKVAGNGSEEGISNGDNATYNNQSGVSLNNSLLQAPTSVSDGNAYWSFSLDINENNNTQGRYLSLDDLKVFVTSTQITSAQATTLAQLRQFAGNPVWDMDVGTWNSSGVQTVTHDRTILMDYTLATPGPGGGGSGNDDLVWLLPKSLIPTGPNVFVTIYTRFGTVFSLSGVSYDGRNWTSDAGGEEWRTVSGFTITIPPPVPEAGTYAAGVVVIAGLATQAWRRRKANSVAA